MSVEIKVDLQFEIDITEVSPEHRNADGLTEIVSDILNSCMYDIPGAELKKCEISIEGLD
jgi:ATP-dependent protease Clp ATPase subunit|tara:strand:+ start:7446 stop:7625 length:180 start_codon:yes stop_codon:yes gene_type:complete